MSCQNMLVNIGEKNKPELGLNSLTGVTGTVKSTLIIYIRHRTDYSYCVYSISVIHRLKYNLHIVLGLNNH